MKAIFEVLIAWSGGSLALALLFFWLSDVSIEIEGEE
jgi:hypothetical protein